MPLLALVTERGPRRGLRARRPAPAPPRPRAPAASPGTGSRGAVVVTCCLRAADRPRRRADGPQRRRPARPAGAHSSSGSTSASRRSAPCRTGSPRCSGRPPTCSRPARAARASSPRPTRAAARPPDQHRLRRRARSRAADHGRRQPRRQRGRPGARHGPRGCWSTGCGRPAPRRSPSTAAGSATSPRIVNSNIAIQVNRSPLTPPYVVAAIGDRDPRRAVLAEQRRPACGSRPLAEQFGFVVDRQNETELVPPGGPDAQLRLRYAGAGERAAGQPGGRCRDRRAGARRRHRARAGPAPRRARSVSTPTCRSRSSPPSTRSSAACAPTSTGSSTTRCS